MCEAIFKCVRCGRERHLPGTGFSLEKCDDCRLAARRDFFFRHCPPLYRDSDLGRLPPESSAVLNWKFGPQGLLVLGPTGAGKTRAVWMLVKTLLLSNNSKVDTVAIFDGVSFGHTLSKKYREETAEAWLWDLTTVDLIFFDDLGKLKLTDRAEAELFGVIESRCANLKPILATTNDTGDALAARMTENRGAALVRRLREFCQIVQFHPNDHAQTSL